jgi:hypothetical protein
LKEKLTREFDMEPRFHSVSNPRRNRPKHIDLPQFEQELATTLVDLEGDGLNRLRKNSIKQTDSEVLNQGATSQLAEKGPGIWRGAQNIPQELQPDTVQKALTAQRPRGYTGCALSKHRRKWSFSASCSVVPKMPKNQPELLPLRERALKLTSYPKRQRLTLKRENAIAILPT